MATKAGTKDPYPATPDALIEMMANSDYVNGKYVALKDRKTEVLQLERTADGLNLKVDREVDANLPDIAKKVLGDSNRLVQREVWTKSGAGYRADVVIDSPGKPVKITGTMDIQPAGDGASTWTVAFEIKASVPLVGRKIEQIVADETHANLVKEYEYNKGWLASH